jgi:membrane protein DedA with SNARE-associated domain
MITNKIKARRWFLLIMLGGALILLLISLALYMGEQYNVVVKEFQSVFTLSMILSAVLLIAGIIYLERYRERQ